MERQKSITIAEQKVEVKEKKSSSRLYRAARVAMTEVLGLREGEEVLIQTNFHCDGFRIARAIFDVTRELGGKPVMVIQEKKGMFDFAERITLEAIKAQPDIVIGLTAIMLGQDPYGTMIGYTGRDGKKYKSIFFKLVTGDRRIRGFMSPLVTLDMFERCVPVDYGELREKARKLTRLLSDGKEVKLTSPAGTDAILNIEGRHAGADDGDFKFPGHWGNLPCGEAYICPAIEGCSGTFILDGTIALDNADINPKKPVKVTMNGGYVDKIEGGEEAKMLLGVVKKGEQMARDKGQKDMERYARHIGELGIGLNPAAKMTGNMLEDEKLYKTVHIAIGANYDYDANALIHQDCLIKDPDLWVDGKRIMKKGNLLL